MTFKITNSKRRLKIDVKEAKKKGAIANKWPEILTDRIYDSCSPSSFDAMIVSSQHCLTMASSSLITTG